MCDLFIFLFFFFFNDTATTEIYTLSLHDALPTSARVDFTASMTLGSMGTMSFAGRGLFDGQSKSGWMNMTFSLPPAAQAQLGANPTMEMIFDGRDGFVVYMRSSMFPGLPAGSWVKMDLAKLADKQGVDLGGLTN